MNIEFSMADFDDMVHTESTSLVLDQTDRFEPVGKEPYVFSSGVDGWIMYWTGGNALQAIVCQKILLANGFQAFRFWDTVGDGLSDAEWCILSDYKSDNWRKCV